MRNLTEILRNQIEIPELKNPVNKMKNARKYSKRRTDETEKESANLKDNLSTYSQGRKTE